MNRTIKITGLVSAIVFAGAVLLSACTSDTVGTNDAIDQRKALMKNISKNWKPIQAYAKSGAGSTADVVKYAKAINVSSGKIPGLFPKGTGRGDYSDKVTRALPAIWADWAGFEKASAALAKESATLEKIAATGDQTAIAKQVGVMGKLGCGACHKAYRGAKAK